MPTRAAAGERMMSDFQPIMQADQVQKTADYYNNVFVPLDTVFTPIVTQATVDKFNAYLTGFSGMQTEGKKLVPALAQALGVSQAQAAAFMTQQFPAMAATLKGLPAMQKDFQSLMGAMAANTGVFSQVPAGIAHYEPLVTTMQGNVDDYASASALPSFYLLPWFFIVPGLLLIGLAGWGLWADRRETHLSHAATPTPSH
jgi:hypothetical protein